MIAEGHIDLKDASRIKPRSKTNELKSLHQARMDRKNKIKPAPIQNTVNLASDSDSEEPPRPTLKSLKQC